MSVPATNEPSAEASVAAAAIIIAETNAVFNGRDLSHPDERRRVALLIDEAFAGVRMEMDEALGQRLTWMGHADRRLAEIDALKRERDALREHFRLKRCSECGLRFGVAAPGCRFCRAARALLSATEAKS